MCQRLNTGESNNFYFGIFICIGPLRYREVESFVIGFKQNGGLLEMWKAVIFSYLKLHF